MKLVLASSSPRRRALLASLGIPFETVTPRFEERPTNLSADAEALHFAEEKARSVASLFPGARILAADTLIDCEGEKIGKPADAKDARKILKKLLGKTHRVYTAVVLLEVASGELERHIEKVDVTFRPLTPAEIDSYVATGEPLGKAGGSAIQGEGRRLVVRLDGDEEAAVGLPLNVVRRWLS